LADLKHTSLQRLFAFWHEETQAGTVGLGQLSPGALGYFKYLFKDSFVARGERSGPFRLSFVGTDLEAQIGRKMINLEIAGCFDPRQELLIAGALVQAVDRHRPLLMRLSLRAGDRVWIPGELLCAPFVEPTSSPGRDREKATIFGTLAVDGYDELPPEPVFREIAVTAVAIIE
jgi:PAS domain